MLEAKISKMVMKNFWAKKNVLVTGAGGFVGSHFMEELLLARSNVIGTLSINSREENEDLTFARDSADFIKMDLLDFGMLKKSIFDKKIDTIIHCASLDGNAEFKTKNSARIMDENSRMTSNILNVAKELGIPNIVLISSAEIYATQAVSPIDEDDDYQKYFNGGGNGYVLAKIFSEVLGKLYARQFGINVFSPRPTNIYGPRDKFDVQSNRVIPSIIHKVFHDEDIEIWGDGSQIRGFVYVKDLVHAILKMVESGEYQIMNIATSESISILDLAKSISNILRKEARIKLLADKPMGVKNRILNNVKLQSIVDFTPKSLEEGLHETIEWYKKIKQ